jgi:hypothetical protein
MQDLWEAAGRITLDVDLRARLKAQAQMGADGKPAADSIKTIQNTLGEAGIPGVSVYAAAEICRWLKLPDNASGRGDGPARIGKIQEAAGQAAGAHSRDFYRALGLVCLDGNFRDQLREQANPGLAGEVLAGAGMRPADAAEVAVLHGLATSLSGQAADFSDLAWESGSCLSRLRHYPRYDHPNR